MDDDTTTAPDGTAPDGTAGRPTEEMAAGTVRVDQEGAVRFLTLDRPKKHNALNGPLMDALGREMERAGGDPGTSVVVVRGAGPSFSSGWDLAAAGGRDAADDADVGRDRARLAQSAARIDRIWNCPIPVIAQVHGYCLAGGADLALHCDLLVVAEDAQIGYPPVRSLGVPTSHLWASRAGSQLARFLLYTGSTISGAEAARRGLALRAVTAPELSGAVREIAAQIALCSRDVLRANKRVLQHGDALAGREALRSFAQEEDLLAHLSPSAAAFRERVRTDGLAAAARERDARFGTLGVLGAETADERPDPPVGPR